MKLIGVGICPIHGIVVAIWNDSDAHRFAPLESVVMGTRSSSEWSLASDCFDVQEERMEER